mmetsp:Transcript_58143/g.180638  ORF Transcript_58143/g.180638 Transcript_58143/m.180638 type:complete len:271 (-) Transcript_58143:218-1030(-)
MQNHADARRDIPQHRVRKPLRRGCHRRARPTRPPPPNLRPHRRSHRGPHHRARPDLLQQTRHLSRRPRASRRPPGLPRRRAARRTCLRRPSLLRPLVSTAAGIPRARAGRRSRRPAAGCRRRRACSRRGKRPFGTPRHSSCPRAPTSERRQGTRLGRRMLHPRSCSRCTGMAAGIPEEACQPCWRARLAWRLPRRGVRRRPRPARGRGSAGRPPLSAARRAARAPPSVRSPRRGAGPRPAARLVQTRETGSLHGWPPAPTPSCNRRAERI